MPETSNEAADQDFVAAEHMTQEQQDATEIRERRTKLLGPDGFLQTKDEKIGSDQTEHHMIGRAKGHDVHLIHTTEKGSNMNLYEGTVDGEKIDGNLVYKPMVEKLWSLYVPITDANSALITSHAHRSLLNEGRIAEEEASKKHYESVIDELLDGAGDE